MTRPLVPFAQNISVTADIHEHSPIPTAELGPDFSDDTDWSSRHEDAVGKSICAPGPVDDHLSSQATVTDLNHLPVDRTVNGCLTCHRLVEVGMCEQDLPDLQPFAHHLHEVAYIICMLGKDPDT